MFTPLSASPIGSGFNISPFGKNFDSIFSEAKTFSQKEMDNFSFINDDNFIFSPLLSATFSNNKIPSHFTEIVQRPTPILKLPEKLVKKAKKEIVPIQEIKKDSSRDWIIISNTISPVTVNVTSKTRCEEASAQVPDVMYSSLKYEIKQTVSGDFKEHQFLLGRISLTDSSGNSLGEKALLKGLVECALTKTNNSEFEGIMKVQFSDVSYSHKKGDLSWQIQYYLPSDLENPVLIVLSASYKVYARKPTTNKRKTTNFDEFTIRLEELMKASKKLKSEEKKIALEMASKKLKDLDPNFFKFNPFDLN